MEEKELKVTDELLQNLSVDDIVDLKIETEDLLEKIDEVLENCNKTLSY